MSNNTPKKGTFMINTASGEVFGPFKTYSEASSASESKLTEADQRDFIITCVVSHIENECSLSYALENSI